jgi:membrane-bound lytic murein transglycosylase B
VSPASPSRNHCVGMPVRRLVSVSALVVAGGAALVGCGGAGPSADPGAAAAPPGPHAALPTNPQALAGQLSAADVALRGAIDAWRADGHPASGTPPRAVVRRTLYVERAVRLLSRRPRLAAATISRLHARLAQETRELTAALRDLGRLSAGWPANAVRAGPAQPLGKLLAYYRAGQRRFGVGWHVLAAVNLVESAFGRVRNDSVASARGPMQFIPSTWRAYGLGGDVRDPRDAILGAANLLHQAGAPDSYSKALYAYNPSTLYVDAVRRYARLIAGDRDAVYFLYSWRLVTHRRHAEHRPANPSEGR